MSLSHAPGFGAQRKHCCIVVPRIEHRRAGQKLHAVAVALEPDVNAASVLQAVAGMLAAYMVPRGLELVEALPVTPNGKVDYRQLVTERTENG